MTRTKTYDVVTCREFQPSDFPGVQALWRSEAGWGELTREMFDAWYVDIPDGPAILVVAEDEGGAIVGLITMTPHRVALPDKVAQGARIAANVVSSKLHTNIFDFANHPLPRMLLECQAAARRRGFSVLFGLPKVSWMNLLRLAEAKGVAIIPHTRIGCMERAAGDPPAAEELVAAPIARFSGDHAALWSQARRSLEVRCAIHRDLETLSFRNGGHRNFEIRTRAGGLVAYASVRKDGLLFDIVAVERSLYTPVLAAVLGAAQSNAVEALKVMKAPYFDDLSTIGFVDCDYEFGFVCNALDPTLAATTLPSAWYLAGGG